MTDHDDVMAGLDTIIAGIEAIIGLLGVTPTEETEDDVVEPEGPSIVSGTQADACTHQHQAIKSGELVCAKCGYSFGATGIGTHVAGSGTREGRR